MKLADLLKDVDVQSTYGNLDGAVSGVEHDSRRVGDGTVFVAIRGGLADGNDFVAEAIRKGAAAVVSEAAPRGVIPWVQVSSDRSSLATLAANYYDRPTTRMHLVGITGTNGKTTTTYLLESILKAAGYPVAVLGTIDYRGPGFIHAAERTTPEAPELERIFRSAFEAGCRHAVMEVSSHSIALRRVEQLEFEVVLFTNLSGDHLDFHGGMEAYFQSKRRLFSGLAGTPPPFGVINRDDASFGDLQDSGPRTMLSYGLTDDADIYPTGHSLGSTGIDASFQTPRGPIGVQCPLIGRPNLYNVAASVGVALALDLPSDAIVAGLRSIKGVPGRFESVDRGQPFRCIVDYAHTDDALDNVLRAAREITEGKLVVVFGCGGERDITKRSRMGVVAGRLSDFAVVTSDNPRGEDPREIIEMVEEGLRSTGRRFASFEDRRDAIAAALGEAGTDDTVVIAGKGHETYQVIGNEQMDFDDRMVARELLDELQARRNS
jgi:UDP-N-acetylmuramoyl-L-alanyl-D-glutamate--2,6-diaminopimelate ligase